MAKTLPAKRMGSKTASRIHLAVGRALSEWEHIETNMAQIFGHLCKWGTFGSSSAAERAYGTIISGQSRYQMLLEALKNSRFMLIDNGDPIEESLEAYRSLGGKRNEIAHGYVTRVRQNEEDMGHFLVAPAYNSRKNFSFHDDKMWDQPLLLTSRYSYNADEIDGLRAQFSDLRKKTFEIATDMFRRSLKHYPKQPTGQ